MAQLGARLNGIEKVVGSNPTGSTCPSTLGPAISTAERPFLAFDAEGRFIFERVES